MKIPKILHQIWIGQNKMPDRFKIYAKTREAVLKDWEYKLWTDKEISQERFINQKCIDMARSPAEKADIMRYELIYKYGGVYADVDFEWYKDITSLLRNCTRFVTRERGWVYTNSIFGEVQKGGFLADLITTLPDRFYQCEKQQPNIRTGPHLVAHIVKRHRYYNNRQVYDGMETFPSKHFFPYITNKKANEFKDFSHLPECYAVHRWTGSWKHKGV